MNDREKAGFRGLVAVCETQWPSGALRESFHRDGRRDENCALGEQPWSQRWIYDDQGRLKQVLTSDKSGEYSRESYAYNDDSSVVQTSYLKFPPGCSVMLDSMLHLSGDAVRITTLQDSRGNALEKVLYDTDDRPIQRVLFLYDSAGRLIEEGEALGQSGIRDDFRNRFRYDAAGRIVQIERYTPAAGMRQTMVYNELGDVIERHHSPLPTDIDMFDQPPWGEYFTYTYDEQSNWISRRLTHRLDESGETTHTGEESRRVEYWS